MDNNLQTVSNPQDMNQLLDQMPSKNQGVKSIIQRFQSNSQIIQFSNYFNYFQNKNKIQFSSQILYCGNASDLWGLLSFQVKTITSALAQQSGDSNIFKRMIDIGQLFTLHIACTKIQNKNVRSQIEKFYNGKLLKYQEQTRKQINYHPGNKEQISKFKSALLDRQRKVSQRYSWVSEFLLNISFKEQNTQKIKDKLKQILKKLISIVKNKFKQEEINKIEIRVTFVCIQLLFVLKNMSWKKVCVSQFIVSDHLIKYLGQKNGAMKIAKYLHDASLIILNEDLQKFYNALYLKNE